MGKFTDKEKEQWNELLIYIEKEILGYDENQHLQKSAVLRILGLRNGQNVANNKIGEHGHYGFDVILNTFKINRKKILNAIRFKDFENEEMKIAYINAIVRNGLNDMYERMQRVKKAQDDSKKIDTTIIRHKGSAYKRKTEDKEQFGKLW